MNLNELWSGQDYALFNMRGRGEVYRSHAQRVKIIKVYKKQIGYNERQSGFAEVLFCDEEGNPKLTNSGEHWIREVRARDIAMRWDEYIDEREHREAHQQRLAKEAEERRAKEIEDRAKLSQLLIEKYGIPADAITSIDDYTIRISRHIIEGAVG